MNYNEPLHPGKFYHIFNHAVGNENLFRNDDNYRYFLKRFDYFITPVAATYAYCLLPNHFHFLIRIREVEELEKAFRGKHEEKEMLPKFEAPDFAMQSFSNLFNSYAKAYNKRFSRKGALFLDYMKRKEVANEKYFEKVIHYIHHNAIHHGLCKSINDWYFTSYHSIISGNKTALRRDEVLAWFRDAENYKKAHQLLPDEKMVGVMEFT